VPLIDDAVARGSGPVDWDPEAGAESKPLLTRAEPLDRGAAMAAAMRLAAVAVLLLVVVAIVLVVAGVL
jgi:hypothetical protein